MRDTTQVEGNICVYLGLDISRNEEEQITLRQVGLIDKVISLCSLESESNTHNVPADTILQQQAANDRPHQLTWSYCQVIGILNYIAASSHLDISFAVHQCARFSSNPMCSHELAVKRIVRYLKGTKDKGYILKPTFSTMIDCYVDAGFAGS